MLRENRQFLKSMSVGLCTCRQKFCINTEQKTHFIQKAKRDFAMSFEQEIPMVGTDQDCLDFLEVLRQSPGQSSGEGEGVFYDKDLSIGPSVKTDEVPFVKVGESTTQNISKPRAEAANIKEMLQQERHEKYKV